MMFTEALAAKIVKGEKTATRRVMSDKPGSPWYTGGCKYKVDQVFAVNPGRGVLRVADAKITRVTSQAPLYINGKQATAEGFESSAAFLDAFCKINPKVDVTVSVWVVEFDPTGPTCLSCDGSGLPGFQARIDAGDPCDFCFGTGIAPSERAKALVAKLAEEEAERSA